MAATADGDSSVKAAGILNMSTDTIMNQFTCPVCSGNLREPIVTCKKGHNVCKLCRKSNSSCPVEKNCTFPDPGERTSMSRTYFTSSISHVEIRNVALEKLIETLELPVFCKQFRQDCKFVSKLAAVLEHEEDCDFRSVHCPVLNCHEAIKYSEFRQI